MQKIIDIIAYVVIGCVVAFTLVVLITPKFGYLVVIVQSGSMEPEIEVGSMIVVKESGEYESGDIVSFKDNAGSSDYVTHRIVEIKGNNDVITKGDANSDVDSRIIKTNDIEGELWLNLPVLGTIYTFLKSPLGLLLLVLIPGLIIIRSEVNEIIDWVNNKMQKVKNKANSEDPVDDKNEEGNAKGLNKKKI